MTSNFIFDLDGTLWDTTAACTAGWNRAMKKLGLNQRKLQKADLASMMGLTPDECRQNFFPDLNDADGRKLLNLCMREQELLLAEQPGELYPGVAEGLATLATKAPLYLVSNCEVRYLEIFFESTGLKKFFKDCECFGRTQQPKSKNLAALRKRNHLIGGIYVGDTLRDQQAAEQNQMAFAFTQYGFGTCTQSQFSFKSFPELVTSFLALS